MPRARPRIIVTGRRFSGLMGMMRDDGPQTSMTFPCRFPIKALGPAEADFDLLVVDIVRQHAPDLSEGAVKRRLSRAGQYVAVTVTVQAQSRRQLDNIYLDLTAHDKVIMAL